MNGRPSQWMQTAQRAGAALAEECEAVLDGHYVEWAEHHREQVPVWAWVNLLAHGREDELRAGTGWHRAHDPWHRARSFVAAAMVEAVDAGTIDLGRFQHDQLVPLELDLMDCTAARGWSPGTLANGLLELVPAGRDHAVS